MPPRPGSRNPSLLGLKLLALGCLVLLLAVLELRFDTVSGLAGLLAASRVQAWLEGAGPFAPLVYMLVMAVTVVSPLPTMPLDLLAGRVFGPPLGTLYSALGAAFGSLVSFQLARWFGRDLAARLLKGHILFCQRCSDRLMTKLVFLGRLVPVVSFDLVSYSAGLTRMSAFKFTAASFFGMLPLTFVYNSAGDLVLGNRLLGWIGGGVMVVLFFLFPYWIERYDLFSLRQHFTHGEPGEMGKVGPRADSSGDARP
jgi:uncharacterized membrane protein YdjX (TVP38/TMEM64 family)